MCMIPIICSLISFHPLMKTTIILHLVLLYIVVWVSAYLLAPVQNMFTSKQ